MKAFIFPGQGSQYIGMGLQLFDKYKAETQQASEILGYDIKEICLNADAQILKQTYYTQPAIYYVSCLEFLEKTNNFRRCLPHYLCGHSLGEYSALFSARVFSLYDGLKIIKKRASLMDKVNKGGMMAILGEKVDDISDYLNERGVIDVEVANYNSKKQIVLSGSKQSLNELSEELNTKGYKCIHLNVSGAFHSSFMNDASVKFMKFLKSFEFNDPAITVISSSDCEAIESKYMIEVLGLQLRRSVYWMQCINYLKNAGVTSFEEIGPGKTLSKLVESM